MENSFDGNWGSNQTLNNFFFAYEKDVLTDYLISLNHASRGGFKNLI
jgi:hypothetical protein